MKKILQLSLVIGIVSGIVYPFTGVTLLLPWFLLNTSHWLIFQGSNKITIPLAYIVSFSVLIFTLSVISTSVNWVFCSDILPFIKTNIPEISGFLQKLCFERSFYDGILAWCRGYSIALIGGIFIFFFTEIFGVR